MELAVLSRANTDREASLGIRCRSLAVSVENPVGRRPDYTAEMGSDSASPSVRIKLRSRHVGRKPEAPFSDGGRRLTPQSLAPGTDLDESDREAMSEVVHSSSG